MLGPLAISEHLSSLTDLGTRAVIQVGLMAAVHCLGVAASLVLGLSCVDGCVLTALVVVHKQV